MKQTKPAVAMLAAGLITGCGTPAPSEQPLDYWSSGSGQLSQQLEVPPDLTTPVIQNKYVLPTVDNVANSQTTKDTQERIKIATGSDTVRLERAGNERWLVVTNKTPEQLWPILKTFWQENGFVITTEKPDIGIMETDWAENRAKLPQDVLRKFLDKIGLSSVYSTSQKDKFRIRLEKTATGTEIYFSHRGMEEVYINPGRSETRWQPRPTDTGLEAELLTRFMIRLGMPEEKARDSVKQTLAQKDTQSSPIQDGVLTINDAFDRAWRRVGLALDRIGLVVNDRDRSKGLYYVKVAKSENDVGLKQDKGFWSTLAFWKTKESQVQPPIGEEDIVVEIKQKSVDSVDICFIDKQGHTLKNAWTQTALEQLAVNLK